MSHSKVEIQDSEYVCKLDAASLAKAKKELNEDPKERLGAVRALREWVQQQPHIKCRTDTLHLLMFLRGAKFSQLKARKMLEGTYTVHTNLPQWFRYLDTTDQKILKILDTGFMLPLPKRTKDGCRILLFRYGAIPAEVSVDLEVRLNTIVSLEHEWDEGIQVNGRVYVFDLTGTTLKHNTRWGPDKLRKWVNCWQGNFPGRYKSFHFYNMGAGVEAVVSFMLTMMTSKLKSRVHLHGHSLDGLYKHIPMELLPEDYLPDEYTGPHAGSIKEITANFRKEVTTPEFRNRLLRWTDGRYGINDKLRPAATGMEASFRKLNVD